MSTTVKTGWLNDKDGNKFAPKTLSSQVQTSDGILFEDKIQTDLDTFKAEVLESTAITVDTELSSESTNPVQNKVVAAKFDSVDETITTLETTVGNKLGDKANIEHNHDDVYYTQTQVDAALEAKANTSHTHDDLYYTEAEIDEKIEAIPDSNFVIAVTDNGDNNWSADKTFAEIAEAYENGQVITCQLGSYGVYSMIDYRKDSYICFAQCNMSDGYIESIYININVDNTIDVMIYDSNIGDIYSLETESNNSIVEAINEVNSKISSHTHTVGDVENLQSALDERVPISRTVNGKTLSSNITLSASDVGADAEGSATSALEDAKAYVNEVADTKSDVGHTHNDIYYTESEIDTKVSEINASITNIVNGTTIVAEAAHASNADNATNATNAEKAVHDNDGNVITSTYETKTDASSKLSEAKSYADSLINSLEEITSQEIKDLFSA